MLARSCLRLACRLSANLSCVPLPSATVSCTRQISAQQLPSAAVDQEVLPFADIPRVNDTRHSGDHVTDLMSAGGPSHMHRLIDSRHKRLGGIFVEEILGSFVVFVSDSGLIRQVFERDVQCPRFLVPPAWQLYNQLHGCKRGLFFMNGHEWRHHRSIMNRHLLRPTAAAAHGASFNGVVDQLLDSWAQQQADADCVDGVEEQLYCFSVDVLAQALFGDRFGALSGHQESATTLGRQFAVLLWRIFDSSARLSVQDVFEASRTQAHDWLDFCQAVGQALSLCGDYVQLKIAEIERQLAAGQRPAGIAADILASDEPITTDCLAQIITDLFMAGGDTTAHSTQWALYRLSGDQCLQHRLLRESQAVQDHSTQHLSADDIDQMPLLKSVMKETLRMYPVAPFLTRLVQKETTIGNYTIPAGTPLCISLYSASRDSRFFPEPLRFLPDRWLRSAHSACNISYDSDRSPRPQDKCRSILLTHHPSSVHHEHNRRHRHACMPFSMGPRGCVGKRLAELQIQLLLARLVRRFSLRPHHRQKPAQFVMRMVGVMSEPLQLSLQPRQPQLEPVHDGE